MRTDRQLHLQRRLALSPGARGFTLLELGIVLSVIAVLTVSVAAGSSAYLKSAAAERTAKEMEGLLRAARDAAGRVIYPDYTVNPPAFRIFARNGAALSEIAGFAGPPGSPCNVVGSPQDTGPRGPDGRFTGINVRGMMGGPAFEVLPVPQSPYNQTYTVCLNARRIEVQTCVPLEVVDDAAAGSVGEAVFRGMGSTCFTPCPGGFVCRTTSTSLLPARSLRLQTSYTNGMFQPMSGISL
ncbi:MAG: type II secretion system protein [Deltaproteobacteria bacterium]|nr:type II secretion system protein [Deltaproteobacteria bacterium]